MVTENSLDGKPCGRKPDGHGVKGPDYVTIVTAGGIQEGKGLR